MIWHRKIFKYHKEAIMKNYHLTDPEFAERFEHFAFEEVVHEEGQTLDEVTRHMAVLAALLGLSGR